jgi:predicted ATPase
MEDIVNKIRSTIDNTLSGQSDVLVTYIIGNNGTGKSRILRSVAMHYDSQYDTSVKNVICISNSIYDRFPLRGDRLTYLGARSAPNAIFHGAIDRELARHIARGIAQGKRFNARLKEAVGVNIFMSLSAVSSSGVKRVNSDPLLKAIDQRKMKSETLEEKFSESELEWLRSLLGVDIELARLKKAQAETLSKFLALNPSTTVEVEKEQNRYPFSEMSSGEQNRILMAAKIMSAASDRTLLLIDEPEVSLHLHWQMEFHKDLLAMLKGLHRLHVVVATHSPVLVSEAARYGGGQSDVVVLHPEEVATAEEPGVLPGFKFSSKQIKSCDALVLDFFDTATYRTRQVVEEVADLVLMAVNDQSMTTKVLSDLQVLLGKKGIVKSDVSAINQAKTLVKQYIGRLHAEIG